MINIEKLASVLMRRCKCSREEALTALADAWLTADHTKSEPEVAAYLLSAGSYRYLDTVSPQTKYVQEQAQANEAVQHFDSDNFKEWDGSVSSLLELTLKAPEEEQTEMEYILEIAKAVPSDFNLPVIMVCHDLLDSRIQNRKPLTVEMTRQLLKRRKVPNTSEVARQVFTFLTTFRRPT